MDNSARVTGWWVFAGVLLFVGGALNIIYGIAAIDQSKFFAQDVTLIATNLKNWGWVTVVLGVVELIAAFSLFGGGGFGRFIGIVGAALTAIATLVTVPAAPIWSLCVFILSLVVLYELAKAPENA
ncbi:MAG: DUF7144 family membrane protein [Solirubrobacterales bacterium]